VEAEHDFGHALSIDAEALGQPGQRRFRLLVRSSTESVAVWLEKQQLAAVGLWLEEALTRIERDDPRDEPDVEPMPFNESFELDFRASQLALAYDESERLFAIQAFNANRPVGNQAAALHCRISRGQARVLSRKIAEVVAAGRPICPLCNQPMDPAGHTCPRSNGHRVDDVFA
jgi:uncharacterized repeat protein (TIGR03847 family)